MMIAYKYRIYPTIKQIGVLDMQMALCRNLYNAALEHRITAYHAKGISIEYKDQQDELPSLKKDFPEYKVVHSQALRDALSRVDLAFRHFYRRIKRGESPGFPRFKGKNRYHSICYPQSGFSIEGNRLNLSKVGKVIIKLHRRMEGKIKTCTIKRDGKCWYVTLSAKIEQKVEKKPVTSAVGVDLGLENFAVMSDGSMIENPRYLRKSEKKLKELQSAYSKKKSKTKKKRLSGLHRKVANQRSDFLHKLSRQLVDKYDLIVIENLEIKKMMEEGSYAKSIQDVSWGSFISMLRYKAERAGAHLIRVDPRHTSQKCSGCGAMVQKHLWERIHLCPDCGLTMHRDLNASINILKSGTDAVIQMLRQHAVG